MIDCRYGIHPFVIFPLIRWLTCMIIHPASITLKTTALLLGMQAQAVTAFQLLLTTLQLGTSLQA